MVWWLEVSRTKYVFSKGQFAANVALLPVRLNAQPGAVRPSGAPASMSPGGAGRSFVFRPSVASEPVVLGKSGRWLARGEAADRVAFLARLFRLVGVSHQPFPPSHQVTLSGNGIPTMLRRTVGRLVASERNTWADPDAGSRRTTGTPSSPASRIAMSSGI